MAAPSGSTIGTVSYNKLPDGIDGRYDRLEDEIVIDQEQECKRLSAAEFESLYQTLYHEVLHANETLSEYTYRYYYEFFSDNLSPSHEGIYKKERELVTGRPGEPGTSIRGEIKSLYGNTRKR